MFNFAGCAQDMWEKICNELLVVVGNFIQLLTLHVKFARIQVNNIISKFPTTYAYVETEFKTTAT
jgi:hypothetical protein